MVLESCMILLDNSEHMRNGDYIPTRLEAQHDAANFLIGRKTSSNPENTVGILAMTSPSAKAGAELLVSPTDDMAKILSSLHDLSITSTTGIDLTVSIQVASLALKHRRNKNGSQRIIVFVGSPLPSTVDSKALSKAGRMLKKNNVSIDIIVMGEVTDNQDRLKELVDAANGNNANVDADRMGHLVTIPAGVLPSDVLLSSPIVTGGGGGMGMSGEGGAGGAPGGDVDAGASGGFSDYGGVDPNMDPELAMALRVSMEEERARQERIAAASAAEETKQDTTSTTAAALSENANGDGTLTNNSGNNDDADEDALLQQALAMSMAEGGDEEGVEVAATAEKMEVVQENVEIDDDDEDAAIQLALQMSMQPDTEETPPATEQSQQQFQDPAFVNQLLGSLPGVDPNDPSIQNALRNLNSGEEKNEADNKKEDSSKDKKEDS